MKPELIRHLTDSELFNVEIISKELALAFIKELGNRDYLTNVNLDNYYSERFNKCTF